ncbi:50S ribosomal protein L5 [Candidatus Peregrinibacteria bacterium]|nr:50S ribosomal protein L5 [Candidatus Peregrinibacteria bacterium]
MSATPFDIQEHYKSKIVPELKKELNIKNPNAVPKITKITLNIGLGSFISAKKDYTEVVENLANITGQKPVVTKSRKSISNFKIRENQAVGVMVTLRGRRMYSFLNKLVHITFPRVRDFRGINPKAFDGHGNYSVGLKENIVFPEINPDNVDRIHGVQVTIITNAGDDEKGFKLLKAFGFPFQVKKESKKKK